MVADPDDRVLQPNPVYRALEKLNKFTEIIGGKLIQQVLQPFIGNTSEQFLSTNLYKANFTMTGAF